jgi:chitinase
LRSAVEHNPLDGDFEVFDTYSKTKSRKEKFLDIVHFSRESKRLNTDAYIIPTNPYDSNPYNYRSGSPYQQLVDEKTFQDSQLNKREQGNLRVGNLKSKEYKVVCHTTNWSFYRKGEGKFVPENLDYNLCTHIIYSFASLDPELFLMSEFDPWADIENKLYSRTVKLANGKPVYLAIGGWTDSTNGKYSKMVSDSKLRANFIDNAVPFLKRFGFSGLHVDWNYPVCPQSDCKRGNPSDKTYFTQFIQELQSALQQSGLRCSISISGYKEILTQAYEFAPLSKAVDFMTIMTFDYHGAWENVTGHVRYLLNINESCEFN